MDLLQGPLGDGGGDACQALAVPLDRVALVGSGTCQLLGCLEEVLGLVVGKVATFCGGVALLDGCSSAVKLVNAGCPLLQFRFIAGFFQDVCNTTVDVAFLVAVNPKWA